MSTYAYINLSNRQVLIDDDSLNFIGAWSDAVTYAPLDVVNFGNGFWMALANNVDTSPPSNSLRSSSWSCLVLALADPAPAPEEVARHEVFIVTGGHATVEAAAGTLLVNFAARERQSVVLESAGTTLVSVTGQKLVDDVSIRMLASSGTHNLRWDAGLRWLDTLPPPIIPTDKAVIAEFTSYGTNVSDVYGVVRVEV